MKTPHVIFHRGLPVRCLVLSVIINPAYDLRIYCNLLVATGIALAQPLARGHLIWFMDQLSWHSTGLDQPPKFMDPF